MSSAIKIPTHMTIETFLDWAPQTGQQWQLIDGIPIAMAPASDAHGAIQSEIAFLLISHLRRRNSRCRVVTAPGIVPKLLSAENVRIPDLAVTCAPEAGQRLIQDPILAIEILSPSNAAETWTNIWAYASIPSITEILIVASTEIRADLLRRNPDQSWPAQPEIIKADGVITLTSIEGEFRLIDLYRTTRFGQASPAP